MKDGNIMITFQQYDKLRQEYSKARREYWYRELGLPIDEIRRLKNEMELKYKQLQKAHIEVDRHPQIQVKKRIMSELLEELLVLNKEQYPDEYRKLYAAYKSTLKEIHFLRVKCMGSEQV